MLFKDLINSVTEKEMIDYFLNIDSEKEYIDKYCILFNDLRNREIEKTNMQLFLVWQKDYFDEGLYISVLGYDLDDKEHYALDFMSRNRWLGSEVLEKSLIEFGKIAFVCECMTEMSFISFDEARIEEEKQILEERVKEIKEGVVKTIPAEEVFENLREKYGWEVHEVTIEENNERAKKIESIKDFNDSKINEMLENKC